MPSPRFKTKEITLQLPWLGIHRCIQKECSVTTMLYNLRLHPRGTDSNVCRVTDHFH